MATAAIDSTVIVSLAIADIDPDPTQICAGRTDDLAPSIAELGVLDPVTVYLHPEQEGRWMLEDGERRFLGARTAGLFSIPARIIERPDEGMRLLRQLTHNTGEKPTPLQEARAFARVLALPGWSHRKLAQLRGIAKSYVTDRLALLKNEAWLPLLESGEITVSQMVEASRYADRYPEEHIDAIADMRDRAGGMGLAAMYVDEFRVALKRAYGGDDEATTSAPTASTSAPPPQETTRASAAPPESAPSDNLWDVDEDERTQPAQAAERSASEPQATAAPAAAPIAAPPAPVAAVAVERRCIECGCTDSRACEGGCRWLAAASGGIGVCSRCATNGAQAEAMLAAKQSPRSSTVAPAGTRFFAAMAPLVAERPVMLTLSQDGERLRVNVIPQQKRTGETGGALAPLSVAGTVEQLDEDFGGALAAFLARRGQSPALETKVTPPAAPARKKKAATKNAVAKPSTKKASPAKRGSAGKAGAKKATPKKLATKRAARAKAPAETAAPIATTAAPAAPAPAAAPAAASAAQLDFTQQVPQSPTPSVQEAASV